MKLPPAQMLVESLKFITKYIRNASPFKALKNYYGCMYLYNPLRVCHTLHVTKETRSLLLNSSFKCDNRRKTDID